MSKAFWQEGKITGMSLAIKRSPVKIIIEISFSVLGSLDLH
jgi:hypothetical protein